TGNLFRRVWQHREGTGSSFTAKYNLDRLVWFEETDDITVAIAREKQIKTWRRKWKVDLVESE
ncbi:MAG: GIY-YIG nuclease family protein, partial [Chloroflexi bacterium]|nr:GIY-YIG nuclease family protein [Chloroflexota bacterium]